MRDNIRIVFAGGGTGGHVFPAIYMANYFKSQWGANCLFFGTKKGIERIKVSQAGFPVKFIWISGWKRGIYLSNLLFPLRLLVSLIQSKRELRRFRPDFVIGTGGYVAGPVLYQATRLNIPTAIQEQNSYPGITTRLLAGRVDKIFIAYEEAKKHLRTEKPCMVIGNPVRLVLNGINEQEARKFFGLQPGKPTILVFGGSQGSLSINQAIDHLLGNGNLNHFQVIWQTGMQHFEVYAEKYKNLRISGLRIMPFIDRMDFAYRISDYAICRAGAMTLSELAAAGLPAILVPYPYAAAQHQLKNAQVFARSGGALIAEDNEELKDKLLQAINLLTAEPRRLENMSKNIRRFHDEQSLEKIAGHMDELISTRTNGIAQKVQLQ